MTSRGTGRPTIGIAGTRRPLRLPFAEVDAHTVFADYVAAVAAAGGIPVVLPAEPGLVEGLLDAVDGLVLTGGPDLDPAVYGECPAPTARPADPGRDRFELPLVTAALRRGHPLLGICRGLHVLDVASGGTLHAHVDGHEGGRDLRHPVTTAPGSLLAALVGPVVEAGSLHHQAVDRLGEGLRAVGFAPDGTVEAAETVGGRALAVQWHPEMDDGPASRALFSWLVDVAARRSSAAPGPRDDRRGTMRP